jgi:hypothetical protein
MPESSTPVLNSIFGPVKKKPVRLDEEIDFSEVAGNPPGTNIIHVRQPSAVLSFKAAEMGEGELRRHKKAFQFPKSLRESVALLSLCHISPQPSDPERLVIDDYIDLAGDEEEDHIFMGILKLFGERFPQQAGNLAEMVKEEKKASQQVTNS